MLRKIVLAVILIPLAVLIVALAVANREIVTISFDPFNRVELRGFGAFSVKNRPARTGRNPRTGAHVSVDQKYVPFFKTGKEMRERLNRPEPA